MTLKYWKKLVGDILVVSIFGVIILYTINKKYRFEENYKEIERNYRRKMDSISTEYYLLMKKERLLLRELSILENELKKAKNEKDKVYITRPVIYTDKQVDSILSVWYPR